MKYKKVLIPLLTISVILLAGCGRKKENKENTESSSKAVLQPQNEVEEETEEKSPTIITYLVKLSGTTLSLYEVDGDFQKLISSMEINPEIYPKEDVERLKTGIQAYYKEEGFEILENFAN